MISKQDLEYLAGHEAQPGGRVLSVYLGVGHSRAANLNRQFEAALKRMLRSIEQQLDGEHERREFAVDADRVLRSVSDYEPHAQSLVIFCDESSGFFWQRGLNAPLRNDARWEETVYLRPLLEALDEFERYGVILTDRARARLFTIYLGEIEEHAETFAPAEVKYFKSNGTDHGHSQGHFQRKADEHAHWHLKRVAGLMGRWANFYAFERLVLAGPVAAASELYHLLPKRLRSRVVGELPLPVEAGERQVLEATLRFEQEAERAAEIKLVEELIVAAAKQARAATGLESTPNSLQQGRVWRLIYAARFAPRGGQCAHCGMLFGDGLGSCGYCGAAVRPVEDLIERTIERVTEAGGRTEQVRGAAAVRLRAAGGIGAVLRF